MSKKPLLPPFIVVLLVAVLLTIGAAASYSEPTSPSVSILNARGYGAQGNGTTDDAPALNRALTAAILRGPGTILHLPAGTYCLGERSAVLPGGKGGFQLGVAHADGLTIEGEAGTVLLSRDLTQTCIHVEQSRNVTIRHLTLDADPLPYTQGTITAADPIARTLELQVENGYDDIDRTDLQAMSEFRICDSLYSDGWSEEQYFPRLESRERLGPSHWRLTPTQKDYRYDASLIGKKWMLWAKGYKGWSVSIGRSDGCVVDDVRIYMAGSGGFSLYRNESATVQHVYIGPPPGSDRLFAGGGGAMSFFNRGTVIVEDCDFSHIDDDGFNLGTHFVRVVEKTGPESCRTEVWPADFQIGDTLVLWDWQTKVERAEARITEAQKEPDGHWRLRFDHPVDFVTTGEGKPDAPHQEAAADGIDRLVDLNSAGSCILRRNKISSLRARCFLVKTGHSVVEENVFYDTHMPAILAGPEFFWGEGPELRGLVIRHNVFRNVDAPNISVATFHSRTGVSNRDVTIEDNTFEDYGRCPVIYMRDSPLGAAIQVENTDGVTIRANHFGPPPMAHAGINAILTNTCLNVQVVQ